MRAGRATAMSDEQDQAEAIDPDELGDDPAANFPPEKPPGAQAYGAAGAEPHADEPVAAAPRARSLRCSKRPMRTPTTSSRSHRTKNPTPAPPRRRPCT